MEKQGDYFVNDLIQSTQLDIFLVKMRWIGRKKYIQEWMCASILISRASFHSLFHLHQWGDTNQYCIYSELSICQTQGEKALEEIQNEAGSTWLQWLGDGCGVCSAWIGWEWRRAWTSRFMRGTFTWVLPPWQTCWNCALAKSVAAKFVKGNTGIGHF